VKAIREPISFEWDNGNADKNYRKHSVTNQEAEQIFVNEKPVYFKDTKHSFNEARFGAYGKTNEGRQLTVIFTNRKGNIRIITARDMSKKERRIYEKNKKDS